MAFLFKMLGHKIDQNPEIIAHKAECFPVVMIALDIPSVPDRKSVPELGFPDFRYFYRFHCLQYRFEPADLFLIFDKQQQAPFFMVNAVNASDIDR